MTSATDKLLQTLHQRFPGATPKSLQWARTADGQESYDLLLNALIRVWRWIFVTTVSGSLPPSQPTVGN
jgi:hypothetical protein